MLMEEHVVKGKDVTKSKDVNGLKGKSYMVILEQDDKAVKEKAQDISNEYGPWVQVGSNANNQSIKGRRFENNKGERG